jgi:hypothetical protein
VLDELHELDLLEHLRLGGLVQLLLVDDLDRHLLTGKHVAGELDHSIMALAYTYTRHRLGTIPMFRIRIWMDPGSIKYVDPDWESG